MICIIKDNDNSNKFENKLKFGIRRQIHTIDLQFLKNECCKAKNSDFLHGERHATFF